MLVRLPALYCRYVLDNVMVLPEYIVEFQYEAAAGSRLARCGGPSAAAQPQLSAAAVQNVMTGLEPELR